MYNDPVPVNCAPQMAAPDAVAQLMERRAMLMKEVADIDAQMDAIMGMAMKWRELRG